MSALKGNGVIGVPRRRVDGRAKVSGQTRFADDLAAAGGIIGKAGLPAALARHPRRRRCPSSALAGHPLRSRPCGALGRRGQRRGVSFHRFDNLQVAVQRQRFPRSILICWRRRIRLAVQQGLRRDQDARRAVAPALRGSEIREHVLQGIRRTAACSPSTVVTCRCTRHQGPGTTGPARGGVPRTRALTELAPILVPVSSDRGRWSKLLVAVDERIPGVFPFTVNDKRTSRLSRPSTHPRRLVISSKFKSSRVQALRARNYRNQHFTQSTPHEIRVLLIPHTQVVGHLRAAICGRRAIHRGNTQVTTQLSAPSIARVRSAASPPTKVPRADAMGHHPPHRALRSNRALRSSAVAQGRGQRFHLQARWAPSTSSSSVRTWVVTTTS